MIAGSNSSFTGTAEAPRLRVMPAHLCMPDPSPRPRPHRRLLAGRRHRTFSLVCRRWSELVNSPHLLRSISHFISYTIPEDASTQHRFMQRALSFCEWLAGRAAGNVQSLRLLLVEPNGLSAGSSIDISNSISAMLAVCGAKGTSSEVMLRMRCVPLSLGGWLAPLGGSLRHLAVSSQALLRVVRLPHALTALQHCELSGEPMVFEPGPRLPPALTHLSLGRLEQEAVPQQVKRLCACAARLELSALSPRLT